MYKKYLIISSKEDPASMNIVNNLEQFRPNPILNSMRDSNSEKPIFDIYTIENSMLKTENLDLEKINKYDFVIFASKHQSKKEEKSLSIHSPGNFRTNNFGGEIGKVCPSSALFNKLLFEKLNKKTKESNLNEKYNVTLEATHHGPLIEKPCVFIEIGATEQEWSDRRAGFVIAKTIFETIEEFKTNPYREIALGIGGPHYCPGFNKIQKNSNSALSHIIAQYNFPLTEQMILETINKTLENIDFIILDWKGLGNSKQRQELIDILEKNYLQWKKTSDINR